MLEKSIIFDLDGTLWDTSKEIEYVWKNVAENYKIEINKEKINKIMGFTKDEIIKYLFKGNKKEGNEFVAKCQNQENKYLLQNGGHIYPNTINTIKILSNNYDLQAEYGPYYTKAIQHYVLFGVYEGRKGN